MAWEIIQGQTMRPNRVSHTHVYKSCMNTVLFVNATIGFSENLFLVVMSTIDNVRRWLTISLIQLILTQTLYLNIVML